MRQALCRVEEALRGRPARRQRFPAGMFREVPFSPEPLFYGCAPQKKKPFGGPASRCARPIVAGFCRQPPLLQSAFRPPDKSFRKEDGGRGGKEKSPFSKGYHFSVTISPLSLFSFPASHPQQNHSEARQAVAPGPLPRLLPTATIAPIRFSSPPDESFRKEDGGRGGKEKSPFSKGFSPSPRSSSPSSLKKSCAEGESEGSAQRGGAAGAAVLLQWVSRRGRRRSGTWCLRRGS